VRGINVYPSAIEAVVRRFGEVAEYRVDLTSERGMAEMALTVEPLVSVDTPGLAERLGEALRSALALRIPVTLAKPGALPRFEMKAKRWIRH
jgi:phenylacetate-CoA ligase